jgi:hypothetical protein
VVTSLAVLQTTHNSNTESRNTLDERHHGATQHAYESCWHDARLGLQWAYQSRVDESAHGTGPSTSMGQKLAAVLREDMVQGRWAGEVFEAVDTAIMNCWHQLGFG